MSWKYSQSTGKLHHEASYVGKGYSGAGKTKEEGRNNPEMESVKDQGPIPKGKYHIGEAYDDPGNLGPKVMPLTPIGHNALDRTLFRIHGDSIADPGNASNGCVILSPDIRKQISDSPDDIFEVVP
jgi:hypothetical protein